MRIPRRVVVLVDERENYPLLFPANVKWSPRWGEAPRLIQVVPKKLRMVAGDYALAGKERTALIERKGSLRELQQNLLTKDRARFLRAIAKLVNATKRPYLLLDFSPMDMARPEENVPVPSAVYDALTQVIHSYNLRLWYAGNCKHHLSRRILGEQVVRLLLTHAYGRGVD
jgi:ERCC4-type nuclease